MIGLAVGLGFVGSVLATLLMRAIAAYEAHPSTDLIALAMGLELAAGLFGITAWQFWVARGHDRRILIAELVGSVLGTGVALRYGL